MKSLTVKRYAGALLVLLLVYSTLQIVPSSAESISVRRVEGSIHGFLIMRNLDGTAIADGELSQVVQGDRVKDEVEFRFKDGSLRQETAVFSQQGVFRLLSDHVIERGPAFKRSMDMMLDVPRGEFTARYTDDDGKEKSLDQKLALPPDVANGIVPILIKNLQATQSQVTVSMVAATPKPRIVKLVISLEGQEPFTTGSESHQAARYLVKVVIGGTAGLLAPVLGKQPPDTHMWVLGGEAPAFLKSEGPLFDGGPIWRIELVSPAWPQQLAHAPSK